MNLALKLALKKVFQVENIDDIQINEIRMSSMDEDQRLEFEGDLFD
jgi:hypothetical protein